MSRQQEQKDEIDGFTVDGAEIDRLPEADHHAEGLSHLGQPRMRNSDTASHSRRSELFSLEKRRSDRLSRKIENRCGVLGEAIEKLALVGHTYVNHYVGRRQEVGNLH